MQNINVSTIQTILHWEDVISNLKHLQFHLDQISTPTDLIILPEMFTTGFTMNASVVAENMLEESMEWMHKQAERFQAVVTGSMVIKEGNHFFNRLIWMQPDGQFQTYDKRHLFTLAKEHETYQAGNKKLIVEWKGWKICPLICYDLRFPVWARNVETYDLLIYVANWPVTRSHHWKSLLMGRAIENQCYVIGVNRVGADEKGFEYSGDTSLIDYSGKIIYQISEKEEVISTSLDYQSMQKYRSKLSFLPDQDQFTIM